MLAQQLVTAIEYPWDAALPPETPATIGTVNSYVRSLQFRVDEVFLAERRRMYVIGALAAIIGVAGGATAGVLIARRG